jgi:uncharacterized membrane protein YgcG
MRAWTALSEEALRSRNLLKDWAGEGFLTEAQYQRMKLETVCELRCTNIFLRLVLFLFTLVIVGASVGLFFVVLTERTQKSAGICLLVFAAISYAAAEFAVARFRLHGYGIEEALLACSVAFLCLGMQLAMFSSRATSPNEAAAEFLIPAAGAIASLWIWLRFGFPYAFLAAMVFVLWLPGHWTSSRTAQHVIVAASYGTGVFVVAAVRPRYRLTFLDHEYSIAEALLWLGIYLTTNLQLSLRDLIGKWYGVVETPADFSRPFYWATWVLIWCLPPVVLARGLLRRDRFVIAAGAVAALLTLITNKPYLGWPRHTWDPMLLGALLIGFALFVRRWLADGPDGVRHGFTAQRLSGKDTARLNAGAAVLGVASPPAIDMTPQTTDPEFHFGGGDSGGAGASSDF